MNSLKYVVHYYTVAQFILWQKINVKKQKEYYVKCKDEHAYF